jgi:hypothetical protein
MEPISDSANVSLEINYNSKLSRDFRDVNDFDSTTGQYSKYNTALSNSMEQRINQVSPELSFFLTKKKIMTWTSVSL